MTTATDKSDFTNYLFFWVRWLVVIPGALICALAASIPVHLVVMATFRSETIYLSDSGLRAVEYWGYAAVFPIAFINAGTWIAPAGKLHVAAILALVWMGLLAAAIVYVAFATDDVEINWVRGAISVGLGVVGAFLGGKLAHQRWTQPEPLSSSQSLESDTFSPEVMAFWDDVESKKSYAFAASQSGDTDERHAKSMSNPQFVATYLDAIHAGPDSLRRTNPYFFDILAEIGWRNNNGVDLFDGPEAEAP